MKTLSYLLVILLIVACGSQAGEEDALTAPVPTPTDVARLAITVIPLRTPTPNVAAPTNTPPLPAAPTTARPTPALQPGSPPAGTVAAVPTVGPVPSPGLTPDSTLTIPPTPPPALNISVGDARFQVEVATTPEERSQGLAGRPSLAPGTGMLFVYDEPGVYSFTTVGMQFNLDFVWIGANCTVVDLTQGVEPPQPGQSSSGPPSYQSSEPVKYVLEINAEEVFDTGIEVGDAVRFEGDPGGGNSC